LKALITGAGGQLGRALAAAAPAGTELRAVTHAELDIANAPAVAALLQSFAPEVVLNAAAFTGVDAAESAPEAAARANALGPGLLAAACGRAGAWLVHVSSDYVFDGAQARPYDPQAHPNPLSVYGRTKLAGELAVAGELAGRSTVVRASWLYGAGGGFPARMLALMRSRPQLSIVSDQVGVPTHATGLAEVLWALATRRAPGLMHWCDSGVASWYDFAVAIAEEGLRKGLLRSAPELLAISSADYPTPAARPPYSLLDKRATEKLLGRQAPHWRSALRETLA
jgi:dTDP-4-dehydrorhamnose reductase